MFTVPPTREHIQFHNQAMFNSTVSFYRGFMGYGIKVHQWARVGDFNYSACGLRTRYSPDITKTHIRITCRNCGNAILKGQ